MITPGAFGSVLASRPNVPLLVNHTGLPLARTAAGTLALAEDGRGLYIAADLDRRSGLANDVLIALERGDLVSMSFAFTVAEQRWSTGYDRRSVDAVSRLHDVSVVTYPANPHTTVQVSRD